MTTSTETMIAADREPSARLGKRNGARVNGKGTNGGSRKRSNGRASQSTPNVRVGFASFLRISDNLVSRVVEFYDGLFDLESEEEGRLFLDLGRQLMADGRPDEALQLFRKATRARPEDPDAWIELGDHYLRRKAPKAAVTALKKARELGVESARVYRCLAEALQQQEMLTEAEAVLEQGLALDPESAECWYELGLLHDTRGDHEPAVAAFGKAVELSPRKIAYHQRLGFALESAGKRTEAIKSFKAALKLESATGRGR